MGFRGLGFIEIVKGLGAKVLTESFGQFFFWNHILHLGLGWAGLGWAGLGWAGLGWAGLGWAGLGWLGWAGLLGCWANGLCEQP